MGERGKWRGDLEEVSKGRKEDEEGEKRAKTFL